MTNLQNAIDAIRKLDNNEIDRAIDAIKARRTYLARQSANSFQIGDRVSFAARRMQIVGTVTKVNFKTVLVKQDNTMTTWKVHASLLKPVKEMA